MALEPQDRSKQIKKKQFYLNCEISAGDSVNINPIEITSKMNGTDALFQWRMPNKRHAGTNKIMAIPHIIKLFLKAITINHIQAIVEIIPIK
jgi:hypothetical protein